MFVIQKNLCSQMRLVSLFKMLTGLIFKHSVINRSVINRSVINSLRLRLHYSKSLRDSKSVRIHAHSIYSDSLAVCTGKSIWVSRIVLCYLRMDVNLTNFIESNPRQPKNSFPYFVLTEPVIKKNCPTSDYFCCYLQKRGKFL